MWTIHSWTLWSVFGHHYSSFESEVWVYAQIFFDIWGGYVPEKFEIREYKTINLGLYTVAHN